nr:uncharacterized protein LOC127339692 [Lolium perenne]
MTGIQLVSLSPNNEEINGALTYLPGYKHLEIVDCCNGLVLCKSGRYLPVPEYTCRFIVCNPATREWRYLPVPESQRHPCGANAGCYTTILAFDPSWSAQSFYVFNFRENFKNIFVYGISRLEVFSSDLSTWLVDDAWSWDREIVVSKPHNFIGGALHVQTRSGEILVVDGLNRMSSGIPPNKLTIKLPHDHCRLLDGCFGQSSRSLLCAWPEECGRTVAVFSLDANLPCKWSLKHRLTMPDAFGRDNIIGFCDDGFQILQCSYRIFALDSEREVLFSYNINTMKRNVQIAGLAAIYWTIWKLRNRACFDMKLIKSPGLHNDADESNIKAGTEKLLQLATATTTSSSAAGRRTGRRTLTITAATTTNPEENEMETNDAGN